MNTRHLVDPEIAPLLDVFPPLVLTAESLPMLRAMLGAPVPGAPAPAMVPEVRMIPGRHGAPDVKINVFDPPGRIHRAALLHLHGGGMVLGYTAANDGPNAALAVALGVMVVSAEYRLAPETPFPGPQEDCMAALDWMLGVAAERGIDPARIGVMGDSAGAGLAAAAALMARDEGKVALSAQFLTYPMLDHRTGTAQQPGLPNTGEFIWNRAANQFGWDALRGAYAADDARKGWFSPALAEDLAGLPPTFIATGALDLFLEENLAFTARLAGAGVPVELHVYPGAYHGFNIVPTARVTQTYQRDLYAAITHMLLD